MAETGFRIVTTLVGLDDVNVATPTDRQVLTYDLASGKWINSTGATLAAIATSGSASDLTAGTLADARLSANVPLLTAGKLSASVLPSIAITDTSVVASQAAMLALTAQTGDVAVRTDLNKSFILKGSDPTVLANWQELLTPTDTVLSVNGLTGAVSLASTNLTDTANIGLLNVANTWTAAQTIKTSGTSQLLLKNNANVGGNIYVDNNSNNLNITTIGGDRISLLRDVNFTNAFISGTGSITFQCDSFGIGGNAWKLNGSNAAAATIENLTNIISFGNGASAGDGVTLNLKGKSSTTAGRMMADWTTSWSTSTDATRKARLVGNIYDFNGAKQWLQVDTDGSTPTSTFGGNIVVGGNIGNGGDTWVNGRLLAATLQPTSQIYMPPSGYIGCYISGTYTNIKYGLNLEQTSTGVSPSILPTGSDTNIDLTLGGKGTGGVLTGNLISSGTVTAAALRQSQGYIKIGPFGSVDTNNSIAIGYNAAASGTFGSIAIGDSATASGTHSTAVGRGASATGGEAIAIGNGASASANQATIGTSANISQTNLFGTVVSNGQYFNIMPGGGNVTYASFGRNSTANTFDISYDNSTFVDLIRCGYSSLGFATIGSGNPAANAIERMRIDAAGNVVIGAKSAASLFDVFGGTLTFSANSSTSTKRTQGNIVPAWATSTDASRAGRLIFNATDSVADREFMRGEATGTAAKIGFLGASAKARSPLYNSTSGAATRDFTGAFKTSNYDGIDNTSSGADYASAEDLNDLRSRCQHLADLVSTLVQDLGSAAGFGLLNT